MKPEKETFILSEITPIGTRVDPSVLPTGEKPKSAFSTIRQGTITNTLTKIRAVEGKNTRIDPVTGTATVERGNITLTISNYAKLAGLKTSTYQLFDAITVTFTESGDKSPTVVIPLQAYMERRGLKDRKEAKNQVKADMEILRQASISQEVTQGVGKKKNTETYAFVNLADSGEIRRNGDIVFTFGTTFYQMLLSYPVMPYPDQLLKINSKRNPNSFFLLRKLSEHKNMNLGKKNEDIISVKTLLEASPYIPSYEEVMAGNKNVSARIIDPFERDMDELEESLCWNFCHSGGEPLTDEELRNLNYDLFISLLVKTEWKSYPNQSARAEAKQTRTRKVSKKKKP